MIQEFQSPSFRSENMLQFEALLLAGLIVAGSLLRRGSGWSKLCGFCTSRTWRWRACGTCPSLVTVLLAGDRVESQRMVVAAGPPRRPRPRCRESSTRWRRMRSQGSGAPALWPAAVVVTLALMRSAPYVAHRFSRGNFPGQDGSRSCGPDYGSECTGADHRSVGGLPDLH